MFIENVRADPQQKSSAAQRVPLEKLYGKWFRIFVTSYCCLGPFNKFGETVEENLGEVVQGERLSLISALC